MTECDYFLHKHSCDPTSIFERGGVRRRALTERECCDLLNAKDGEIEHLTMAVTGWRDAHYVQEERHKAEIERLQVQLKSEAHENSH